MKSRILLLAFLFVSAFSFAQSGTTITYQDGDGTVIMSYGDMENGKHYYEDVFFGLKVFWDGSKWIIRNTNTPADLFTSTQDVGMNPPDLATGDWQAQAGGTLIQLTGTGVLPVDLVAFGAKTTEQGIALAWETASEENNAGFEVQRSADGKTFETLAFVEGNGTTLETQTYTYTDQKVVANQPYYYRLKQTDYNGQFEYSNILTAVLERANVLVGNFYPNPTRGQANLTYTAANDATVEITVYSVAGQEVMREVSNVVEGTNNLTVDFSALNAGNYFVKLQSGAAVSHQKIVIE